MCGLYKHKLVKATHYVGKNGNLSPYWSTNSIYYTNESYFFKSYYHYIWNIK